MKSCNPVVREAFETLAFILLCTVVFLGVHILEAETSDINAEYHVDAIVTKVDAHHRFGGYEYKVYAVSEDGKAYSDYLSEDEYAIINVGDEVVFEVIESTSCFGKKVVQNWIA